MDENEASLQCDFESLIKIVKKLNQNSTILKKTAFNLETEIAEEAKRFTEKQYEYEKINLDLHAIISNLLKKTVNLYDKSKADKDYNEEEREQIKLLALTIKVLEIKTDDYEKEYVRSTDNIKIYKKQKHECENQ